MNKDTTESPIANMMRGREYRKVKEQERKELRNLRIFAVGLLLLTVVCCAAMFNTTKQTTPIKGIQSWTKKY